MNYVPTDEFKELQNIVNSKGKVYLAGGWFSDEQFERLEWVRDNLKLLGFKVFSPKDENLVEKDSPLDAMQQSYEKNLQAIEEASFVFCITNCKDMGTIHESGYASAKNVPIIYFAEGLDGPFNLMLARSGIHVITSRDQFLKDMKSENILKSILTNKPVESFAGEIE